VLPGVTRPNVSPPASLGLFSAARAGTGGPRVIQLVEEILKDTDRLHGNGTFSLAPSAVAAFTVALTLTAVMPRGRPLAGSRTTITRFSRCRSPRCT
jgi:hypothetical protein